MFDFLFKKRPPAIESVPNQTTLAQQERDLHALNKQAELAQAESLVGQEEAALVFILQSSFADARLQAAQHVHSEIGLLKVSQAMRNIDRRVSKLAQERLARLQYQEKMHSAVQACLVQGQQLLEQPHVMPNQVSTWDKQRLSLGEYGSSLHQIKQELEVRLQLQIDLQRQAIDLCTEINQLMESDTLVEQQEAQLAQIEQKSRQLLSHSLADSLPKNHSSQLSADITLAYATIQKRRLAEKAATAPDEVAQVVSAEFKEVDAARPDVAETKLPAVRNPIDVGATLHALEQALKEGLLQQALDIDKTLRQSDEKIQGELAQKMQLLRSELNRLLDWAKWGGNISREELIKVADGMLANDLSPTEIAKKVGGLRSRWKELDRTSGPATQSLWERFDQACTNAYAVADSFFKEQAKLRAANLQLAQSFLQELDRAMAELNQPISDWKVYQSKIDQFKLAWRKIGTVERKLKTRLDAEFEQKLAQLLAPLVAAREAAVQVRRQLIESVSAINPLDREAIEKVKNTQQRWQQEATAMLIERKDEQDLWRQFRAACDAIFEHRKANAEQQKQQRQQFSQAKQIFCERLENAIEKPQAEIAATLKSAHNEWRELSMQARGLDSRFDAAVLALERKLAEHQTNRLNAGLANLRGRIKLCQRIESASQSGKEWSDVEFDECRKEWSALLQFSSPPLTAPLIKLLERRFSAACEQLKSGQNLGTERTMQVLQQFHEHLLRVESMRNLPSPVALAQQKLQMQVKDLQSAMKNRNQLETYTSNLYALCSLPAALDDETERRLQAVLENSIAAV